MYGPYYHLERCNTPLLPVQELGLHCLKLNIYVYNKGIFIVSFSCTKRLLLLNALLLNAVKEFRQYQHLINSCSLFGNLVLIMI